MNKEFVWTDDLVKQYTNYIQDYGKNFDAFFISEAIEDFKASHTEVKIVDWEIVSAEKNGWIHKWNDFYGHTIQLRCSEVGCNVHSVRRNSDGIVFSLGDEVDSTWGKQRITRFFIDGNEIIVEFATCRNPLTRISKPLQRTPDSIKPPIGIMPEYIWKEQRLYELNQAIIRYINAGLSYPKEWGLERENLINETKPKQ